MHSIRHLFSALLLSIVLAQPGFAAEDPIYTSFFSSNAAGGYDVTAYFSEQKPVPGDEKFSTEYMGANWLFASQENLDKFIADPESYAPQYGGYCAWAAASGNTAKGDPKQWHLHNGKLYLNYDKEIQTRWLADKEALISAADKQWPALLDK